MEGIWMTKLLRREKAEAIEPKRLSFEESRLDRGSGESIRR